METMEWLLGTRGNNGVAPRDAWKQWGVALRDAWNQWSGS